MLVSSRSSKWCMYIVASFALLPFLILLIEEMIRKCTDKKATCTNAFFLYKLKLYKKWIVIKMDEKN